MELKVGKKYRWENPGRLIVHITVLDSDRNSADEVLARIDHREFYDGHPDFFQAGHDFIFGIKQARITEIEEPLEILKQMIGD